jgi:hypothetical protein
MAGGRLRNLSFASRTQEPPRDRAEPRLLPADTPLPSRRSNEAHPDILSATRDDQPKPVSVPAISATDRRPAASVEGRAGSMRHIALVGCVALAVGAVVGARFLVLTGPSPQTVAGPAPSGSPATDLAAGPVSPAAAKPSPATTAAVPGAPSGRAPAAENAPLKLPANVSQPVPQAATSSAPSTPAVPAFEKPVSAANSAVAAPDIADRPASAAAAAAPERRSANPPRDMRRPAHARYAARHPHLRSAREIRSARPEPGPVHTPQPQRPEPPSSSAESSAPGQSGQATSFDQLLARLTGSANPPDQRLTPPAAGAPDPFASHASDGASAQ